ncbi:MarR family winged helix-turn-helix transcriptional regulator [Methylobacterium sp. J-076]|uniref:MarR family winged helix-turn-helix transcriptional regulator n=1 Tax=Methylobacterium sp. J-076 TaxID=2836655 RepID=UPI001FB9C590|nr:MarR family transcriptional regulator [Methylobacterium sp. J-076]MCJ2015681.1 MarR family transcriptional regulator [Methylobacterium sp. J-076]
MSAPPAPDIDACTCGVLRRAARAATAIYDQALRPTGLRVTQFAILRILDRRGPLPVTRLAAEAGLERTTMARNLDPLERRGLVRIVAGEADARSRLTELTDAGRSALAEALPHWRGAQADLARRVEPGAVRALAAALHSG